MKILILGGYGTFGNRLVQLLDGEGHELLIAGRNLARAQAFTARNGGSPVQTSRATIAQALHTHRPDLLVDVSGPFQDYGAAPYTVLQACIASGTHYLDFADGADFVAGITQFDAAAKAAGIFAISGASSFPVLTAAVLRDLSLSMQVHSVTGGIAPSPHARVGPNVLRAVLGYAGRPVALRRDGQPATGRGLAETIRMTVAPPGALPLPNTLFSLVDVPDLRAIPAALPQIRSLWMGAGPRPEPLHRLLIAFARLRLPGLSRLAPLAQAALTALAYGDHRGGMFVQATGTRNGQPVTRTWHMIAEGDDGPLIPTMPIAALIRSAAAGHPPARGARSGIDALSLADYDAIFAHHAITTGWRDDATGALYPRTLGAAFATLPLPLQDLHQPGPRAVWSGRATVTRGHNPAAALICRLFNFPKACDDSPVIVTFQTGPDGREIWSRRFGPSLMHSTQEIGTGRSQHLVTERFGPFAFGLALVVQGERLRIIPRRWSLLGLPLPRALMPRGDSHESARDGIFRFHVEIALPLIGPIVTYDGWLTKDTQI